MYFIRMHLKNDPKYIWHIRGFDGRPLQFTDYATAMRTAHDLTVSRQAFEEYETVYTVITESEMQSDLQTIKKQREVFYMPDGDSE